MALDIDLEREQDLEELRRIAQALQAQNQLLREALAAKSREVERLRGKPGDLQLTLKMLETLQAKAVAVEDAVQRAGAEQQRRAAKRERKRAERTFELSSQGRKNRRMMAPNIASTPPSLLGTARRIA